MTLFQRLLFWLEGLKQPNPSDVDTLARTIYGEARGEPDEGKQGVANVVMKRVQLGWKGDHDAKSVCLHHAQFSCWLDSDPNKPVIMAVKAKDPVFAKCIAIAVSALSGNLSDVTGNADSYERVGTNAYWGKYLTPTRVIGHHAFYITHIVDKTLKKIT